MPRPAAVRYTAGVIDTLHSSPYAVLTLIAAPAVLTNASSVLALGTSNRFARAVDRQRQLSVLLEKGEALIEGEGELRLRQLRRTEVRGLLLLRALTSFYTSLGAFAAAALLSLLGAIVGARVAGLGTAAGVVAIASGLAGVGGLVYGCVVLVRETRVALESLREEAEFTHRKFAHLHPESAAAAGLPPAGSGAAAAATS